MAIEAESFGQADPGAKDDGIAFFGCGFVVDLVAENHPDDFGFHGVGGEFIPMGDGGILHPAEVDDIVDMAQGIDIGCVGGDSQFVRQPKVDWIHKDIVGNQGQTPTKANDLIFSAISHKEWN